MVVRVDTRGSTRSTWHAETAAELSRAVARLRWRLGLERALIFAIRGLMVSGISVAAASALVWLAGGNNELDLAGMAPLVGAFGLAVARWPSRRDAALAADARLGLDDRLATSVELLQRTSAGRFDTLQVADAVGRARAAPPTWLALNSRTRLEVVIALGTLMLGAAALALLPSVPRPLSSPLDLAPQSETMTPDELAMRPLPDDMALPTAIPVAAQPLPARQADVALASRVQQEQAARSALDNLAKALRSISAGQAAADAIEQGDFATAREQLQSLGAEADQLSDAGKQQLAKALQQASAATTQTDRQLADRERQAAQALSRPGYNDQRQALRNLADQVQRSGSRSVPAGQLQRELGQLGQQPGGPDSGINGQQGGPGVGSALGPPVLGDDASRLETAGQTVQVPTRLSGGPGVRPLDGSEDQLSADQSLGGARVAELSRSQFTGQLAPEQNLVPGEQRPVVRGYFR